MTLSLDKKNILSKIDKINSLNELDTLRVEYLGKKGIISNEMRLLSTLGIQEKRVTNQPCLGKQIMGATCLQRLSGVEEFCVATVRL